MKRRYIFTVDATISVVLDSPEPDENAAGDVVEEPTLWWQCSNAVEIGPILKLINIREVE